MEFLEGKSFRSPICNKHPSEQITDYQVVINSDSGKSGKRDNIPSAAHALHDDYERAEEQIFDAIGKLEHNVEKVMEAEVDTLFHDMEHRDKAAIKEKAQDAVKRGAKKVKADIGDKRMPSLPEDYHYPFALDDPEDRLLHAIEHAEKAVLHAVEEEVHGLFHELEHHEDHNEHKKALTKGVAKASKHLDDAHESRRSWFMTNRGKEGGCIEDYEHYLWAIR